MTRATSPAERATDERNSLDEVLDRVGDGIVAFDRELRYTYVNEAAARLLGRDAQSLLGKHAWTEFPESVGTKFEEAIRRALREQVVVQIEEYFEPWKRWYENWIHPFSDGLTIFFSDVTERVQATREVEERLGELDAVHGAGQRLRDLQSPEALTASIIEVLEASIGYEYGAVLTLDRESGRLSPLALSRQGRDEAFAERDRAYVESREPRIGAGVVGWVAEHATSLRIGDVRDDPRYLAYRDDVRSELCVPIVADGETLGVVNVESARLNAYSAADQRVLETIAVQIGVAMRNTRLVTALRTKADELEALHRTALDLIERRSLPDLLDAVMRRAAQLAAATDGFIYVVDEGEETATAVAGIGSFRTYVGNR